MMTDDQFIERVRAVEWMFDFAGDLRTVLTGKRVVEIGSGFGAGAIACLTHGAAQFVGIEPEPFGIRIFETEGFEPGQRACYERAAKAINKRDVIFVEGLADDWPGTDFDICLIADVMEHVESPVDIARSAFRLLKPGGMVLASTAPLYYSPLGHHLFHILSEPWAHLYTDFNVAELTPAPTAFFTSEFGTLNRVTHPELCKAFQEAGFRIERERTMSNAEPDFEQYRARIDPAHLEGRTSDTFQQTVSQILAIKPQPEFSSTFRPLREMIRLVRATSQRLVAPNK